MSFRLDPTHFSTLYTSKFNPTKLFFTGCAFVCTSHVRAFLLRIRIRIRELRCDDAGASDSCARGIHPVGVPSISTTPTSMRVHLRCAQDERASEENKCDTVTNIHTIRSGTLCGGPAVELRELFCNRAIEQCGRPFSSSCDTARIYDARLGAHFCGRETGGTIVLSAIRAHSNAGASAVCAWTTYGLSSVYSETWLLQLFLTERFVRTTCSHKLGVPPHENLASTYLL
eukprot:8190670-Pyramimonas_sp.AAC.2